MKNILIWSLRVFIGLVATIILLQGFMWAFLPTTNLETNGITVNNVLGLNMMKSDIGAGLIATAIISFLFLFNGKKWFLPLVILVLSYLTIRMVSFLIDGSHQTIIIGIILEFVTLLAVIFLNKLQINK